VTPPKPAVVLEPLKAEPPVAVTKRRSPCRLLRAPA
jgi:hypothetical protein